jgi:hypothetical protein
MPVRSFAYHMSVVVGLAGQLTENYLDDRHLLFA